MRIQRLYQARHSLCPITKRFIATQPESLDAAKRYFPHGFTIPSPNFTPTASESRATDYPIEHSLVSNLLAPGYEVGGRLKKIPTSLEEFDEKGLMRWGAVGIPLAMITGEPKANNTFTHRLQVSSQFQYLLCC